MAAVAFVINGTLAKAGGRFLPLCHAAAARAGLGCPGGPSWA